MDETTPNRRDELVPTTESKGDEWLALVDVVRFFFRHTLLILGVTVVLTTVATIAFLLLPRKYEASLTLVVSTPKFTSDLSPSAFSVQGYQALLESGAVLEETSKRLVNRGLLAPGRTLRLDEGLYTYIFVSSRSDATALAPMLRLTARTEDPEIAAHVANTWAEVFLEHTRELASASLEPTLELVEDQFQDANTLLEDTEDRHLEMQLAFQKRLDGASKVWDLKIAKFRGETETRVAAFRNETRRLFFEIGSRQGLADGDVESAGNFEENEVAERLLAQLLILRQQLAQTPVVFELQKTITDDVLWQALSGVWEEETEDRLFAKNLVNEEVNPVYTDLAMRIVQLESQARLLDEAEQRRYWDFDRAIEKLQRERSLELTILQESREIEMAALTRDRRRVLNQIQLEHALDEAHIDREAIRLTEQVETLSQSLNQVPLARARQQVQDVHLAVPAVPPSSPLPRHLIPKVVVVALLGGLLGILIAFLLEVDDHRASKV